METKYSLENNISSIVCNSSVTNSTVCEQEAVAEPPLYIVISSSLLYVLIFLVGIVGNGIVMFVISLSRSMKTSVNMYLMNLCVADILVIIVCMPTALADIYTKEVWYFGEIMCKLVPFLENTVANASVLTILAISVERYRVVCYPLKGIGGHMDKIWKITVAIWVISSLASVPMLSIPKLRSSSFHDGTPITVCRIPIVAVWQKSYVVVLFVLFFLIPCLLLFTLNCHLCRVLHATQECDTHIHRSNERDRKRRQHQVANIIASIVSIFFICHLPFRVAVLWFSFENKNVIYSLGLEKYLNILYSTRIMFYLNHALNPVVYNFVSTKFRCALGDLWTNKRRNGSYIAVSNNKTKRHQSTCYRNNTLSPATQQTRMSTKWISAGNNDCSIRMAREKRNDFFPNLQMVDGYSSCRDDSSSSSNNYDVKLRLENKTVAIKFNVTANKETVNL